jgi:hypothetical protein
MLIRFSLALLLSLLVSAPSQAQLRRMIEHHVEGSALSAAFCESDAKRLCYGVPEEGKFRCLAAHKNDLSLPCQKEVRKAEMKAQLRGQ